MQIFFKLTAVALGLFALVTWSEYLSDKKSKETVQELNPAPYYTGSQTPIYQTGRYISMIENNSPYIRKIGAPIIKGCTEDRTRCIINRLFSHVQKNVPYLEDPIGTDLIQTPKETLKNGGDCEDLSILLASLLTNFSVKTWLVLVPDHMYVMACGLTDITPYEKLYIDAEPETIAVNLGRYSYMTLHDTDIMFLRAESPEPFRLLTFPDINEMNNYINQQPYRYYNDCSAENVTEFEKECSFNTKEPVVFLQSEYDTKINIFPKKVVINEFNLYKHEGMNCVMLDPSFKGNAVTMGMEMPKYKDIKKTYVRAW